MAKIDHKNVKSLLSEIRKDLRKDKDKWVFKNYLLQEKDTIIKTKRFNNWFQIFEINGKSLSLPMDATQKKVLEEIKKGLWNFK